MKNILFRKASVFNQVFFGVLFVPALLAGFLLAQPVFASTWASTSASMILPRGSFASTVVDNKIYVFGGDLGGPFAINEVESYNPQNNEWKVEPSMSESRWGLTAATIDGKIVILAAGSPIPSGSVTTELYDPATGEKTFGDNMPSPGWGAASAVVNGKMYVLGGFNWAEGGQNHNREYNPISGQWTMKKAMNTRRSWTSSEAVDGKVYVIGGWNYNDTIDLASMEAYDPTTDSWEDKASLPIGMKGILTAVLGTKIYAIGGAQGEGGSTVVFKTVYIYDTQNDAVGWVKQDEDFPVKITGGGAEIINGTIYVFGGGSTDGLTNNTYYLGQGPKPVKSNPVIFVPGIEGSALKERGLILDLEIWPDPITYIADPLDLQLGKLKMDENGDSINDIFAADAIRKVLTHDFYGGLIDYLKINGYEENKNLFIFPYDWRLDIDFVAGDKFICKSTTTLKCLIDEVKRETGSDKVDIIAHSMGGLVVKDYAYKFGQDSIGKFINIATPHLGAPKVAKILQYGDNLGFDIFGLGVFGFNSEAIKEISLQMPSMYQLLPSQEYFNIPDSGYGYYLYNDSSVGGASLKGELNYDNSLSYLSAGNNKITKYFTDKNNALHSAIDNVKIDNSYNISGCGIATIGNIKSLGKKAFFWDKYDMDPVDGDGTVPLRSADYYGDNDKKYYLLGKTHSQIPGASEVKDFIYLTLNNQEDRYPFSESKVFKKDDSLCAISGEFIGYHCPVDMHIYDDQGNHTGPVENGDIENNIPGVQYDIIDGNKFAFLPAGGNYRVTGEAVGTGTLEVVIRKVENNRSVETKYFNSIPLPSTAVRTEINLISGQDISDIKIDENGDGFFEEQKSPDTVLSGDDMSDLTKPNTAIGVIGVDGNNSYYVSDVKVSLVASDDNSGVLKTEYSLDGGKIWIKYVGELILTQNGTNTIWYSSTDRAGNREENKELVIKIDTEKPEINIFLPQEGQEILRNKELKLEYLAEDATSGVLPDSKEVYFDGQKANQEVFDMFSYAIGSHKVKIKISDLAGSISEKEVNFKVIADITSTISDIEKLFNEKDIANKKVKDDLIGDLNWVDNYLEKNVKKQVKREEIKKEIMDKCIQKKGEAWCAEKVGRTLDKVDYHLNEIQNKIVQLKYELLLKKLEVYRKLNFVSQKGYNIIKEDIKYLISKI